MTFVTSLTPVPELTNGSQSSDLVTPLSDAILGQDRLSVLDWAAPFTSPSGQGEAQDGSSTAFPSRAITLARAQEPENEAQDTSTGAVPVFEKRLPIGVTPSASNAPRAMLDALVNPGPAPKGAEYWAGDPLVARLVWDVGKGVFVEGPKQAFAGVSDAIGNTLVAVDELSGWLNRNVADLRFSTLFGHPDTSNPEMNSPEFKRFAEGFKAIEHGDTVTGNLIRGTASFVTGFALARRFPGLGGGGMLPVIGAGGVSEFLTVAADDDGLSNFIQEHPAFANPVTEFLATKPGDNAALNRFKHSIEAIGLGIVGEGLVRVVSVIRNARFAKAEIERTAAPSAALPEESLLAGSAGEGHPVPLVKRITVGEGSYKEALQPWFDTVLDPTIDASIARLKALPDHELVNFSLDGRGEKFEAFIGRDVHDSVAGWLDQNTTDVARVRKLLRGADGKRYELDQLNDVGNAMELKRETKRMKPAEKQAENYKQQFADFIDRMEIVTYKYAPRHERDLADLYARLRKLKGKPAAGPPAPN